MDGKQTDEWMREQVDGEMNGWTDGWQTGE